MSERLSPAARTIFSAVRCEPTKPIPSTPRWVTSRLPTSPPPQSTLTTPSGSAASAMICMKFAIAMGVHSDGLITIVLPAAMPGAISSTGISVGKFHGVIAA